MREAAVEPLSAEAHADLARSTRWAARRADLHRQQVAASALR
jgi:hypothetical protein